MPDCRPKQPLPYHTMPYHTTIPQYYHTIPDHTITIPYHNIIMPFLVHQHAMPHCDTVVKHECVRIPAKPFTLGSRTFGDMAGHPGVRLWQNLTDVSSAEISNSHSQSGLLPSLLTDVSQVKRGRYPILIYRIRASLLQSSSYRNIFSSIS